MLPRLAPIDIYYYSFPLNLEPNKLTKPQEKLLEACPDLKGILESIGENLENGKVRTVTQKFADEFKKLYDSQDDKQAWLRYWLPKSDKNWVPWSKKDGLILNVYPSHKDSVLARECQELLKAEMELIQEQLCLAKNVLEQKHRGGQVKLYAGMKFRRNFDEEFRLANVAIQVDIFIDFNGSSSIDSCSDAKMVFHFICGVAVSPEISKDFHTEKWFSDWRKSYVAGTSSNLSGEKDLTDTWSKKITIPATVETNSVEAKTEAGSSRVTSIATVQSASTEGTTGTANTCPYSLRSSSRTASSGVLRRKRKR